MDKKGIYGLTKGTGLEKFIEAVAMGKAMGVMNYYSLALMAEEQGFLRNWQSVSASWRIESLCMPGSMQR